jgi:hypothetical protein
MYVAFPQQPFRRSQRIAAVCKSLSQIVVCMWRIALIVVQMNPEKRSILSSLAFKHFTSRYQPPQLSEGFQDITEINFQVRIWPHMLFGAFLDSAKTDDGVLLI